MPIPTLPLHDLLPIILYHASPSTRAACCLLCRLLLPLAQKALHTHLVFSFDPLGRHAACRYRQQQPRQDSRQLQCELSVEAKGLFGQLAPLPEMKEEGKGIDPSRVRIVELHLPGPFRRDELDAKLYPAGFEAFGLRMVKEEKRSSWNLGTTLMGILSCFPDGVEEIRVTGSWQAGEVEEVVFADKYFALIDSRRKVAEGGVTWKKREGRKPVGLKRLVVKGVRKPQEGVESYVDEDRMREEAEKVGVEFVWMWGAVDSYETEEPGVGRPIDYWRRYRSEE